MMTHEELIKNEGYWTESIENEIYNEIISYMYDNELSKKDMAKKIGISTHYLNKILNGKDEFLNLKIDVIVKICLAVQKYPLLYITDDIKKALS